jgi:hypothetical protein
LASINKINRHIHGGNRCAQITARRIQDTSATFPKEEIVAYAMRISSKMIAMLDTRLAVIEEKALALGWRWQSLGDCSVPPFA